MAMEKIYVTTASVAPCGIVGVRNLVSSAKYGGQAHSPLGVKVKGARRGRSTQRLAALSHGESESEILSKSFAL